MRSRTPVTDRLLARGVDELAMVTVSESFDWAPRPTHRGTSNSNDRGSAQDRRRRKQWLLDTHGDGERVACWYCEALLTLLTLSVDRIVPGCQGGRYIRSNIRAACLSCNSGHGGALRSLQ